MTEAPVRLRASGIAVATLEVEFRLTFEQPRDEYYVL